MDGNKCKYSKFEKKHETCFGGSLYRLVSHHSGAVDLLPTVPLHEIVTLEV